ncbi:uncharacterized protein LOC136078016 isoform X2 [Hydra vulgaris]|uniref:Uncharacterized protein LOC136078012 n=1 Tax=Hydra vulgaris TaxID=6087 RepID=A0ABM4BI25_HYDVU
MIVLLEYGAKIGILNSNRKRAIDLATEWYSTDCINYLHNIYDLIYLYYGYKLEFRIDPSTKRKRRKLLKKCNRMFSNNTLAQPMTRLMSETICSSDNLLKEDQIEATPIDYSKKDIFNYNSEGNVSDTSSDQLTDSSLSVSDIDISTDGENGNVANVSKSLKDFGIETGQSYANMKVLLEKMITHHPELPRDPRTAV